MSELTPLEKAQKARLENGVVHRNPQEKFELKQTRASAINAMCFQCYGSGHDVGWKWMIGNCTSGDSCPLYSFRPFQKTEGTNKPLSLQSGDVSNE